MREKEPSTRLILLRHGKTDFPLDRIYCDDREDPPLNAEGRAQAEQAGRLLRELGADCIYASPIGRTNLTSQIVNEYLNLRVDTDPRLKERHFGAWEGLYFHEIQSSYPDLYEAWKMTPAAFQPPSGESMADLAGRLNDFVSDILIRHKGQTVVVVTHVGPIRMMVTHAMEMPLEMHRYLRVDYASLTRLDIGRSKTNLIYLNYLSQLPR